jgi:glycosyltransferase involved in cell wall biosynthesis
MNTTGSTSPSVEGKSVAKSPAKTGPSPVKPATDLLCFSHLRWNFVYQRPQHLLSRATSNYRVWFLEEPVWSDQTRINKYQPEEGVTVLTPHIPHHTPADEAIRLQRQLLDEFLSENNLNNFVAWYYTPMALLFSDHIKPRLTIYDCMDELSAFWGAPPQLLQQEQRLIDRSAIVFTGGISLFEAKQNRHPQVMAFPSSIDFNHFSSARQSLPDPADQASIARPRIGFSGVIDERFDYELVTKLAQQRPDWQFVLIGPIVKIDRKLLPNAPNVHYPGMKNYKDLPAYFSNWDVAILPFALNDSTRFISPTKTPEYLAAGLPVVSTPIRDVVRTYGNEDFVQIADTAEAFGKAIERALAGRHPENWTQIDKFLTENSWDHTWQEMNRLILANLKMNVEQ